MVQGRMMLADGSMLRPWQKYGSASGEDDASFYFHGRGRIVVLSVGEHPP